MRSGVAGLGSVSLGAVSLGGLATGCSSSGDTVAEGVSAGPSVRLQPLFPRDVRYLAAETESRLPYTLVDAEGVPFSTIDADATFRVSFDGEPVGDAVTVQPRGEGIPRPYLPLPFEFPRPGLYDVEAEFRGETLSSQVQVHPADEVAQPLVGSTLPPADTPTRERSFDVDPICSRSQPCPFHEVNLTDVVGTGVPVIVLLASPAYCQTSVCGPILDLLVDEAGGLDGPVVIHSEVYQDPKRVETLNRATPAPLPLTYEMTWEPSLFVADAEGALVARGDIVVDRTEMAEMLGLVS